MSDNMSPTEITKFVDQLRETDSLGEWAELRELKSHGFYTRLEETLLVVRETQPEEDSITGLGDSLEQIANELLQGYDGFEEPEEGNEQYFSMFSTLASAVTRCDPSYRPKFVENVRTIMTADDQAAPQGLDYQLLPVLGLMLADAPDSDAVKAAMNSIMMSIGRISQLPAMELVGNHIQQEVVEQEFRIPTQADFTDLLKMDPGQAAAEFVRTYNIQGAKPRGARGNDSQAVTFYIGDGNGGQQTASLRWPGGVSRKEAKMLRDVGHLLGVEGGHLAKHYDVWLDRA